ncbi:MAG: lanthionine synthetase C family protein [Bacteroidales bacterium]|nr:lanthionine synthetase C family protein [Bacteroidales bacterium]
MVLDTKNYSLSKLEIENKINSISETLEENHKSTDRIDLMGGKMGIALFFLYYAKYKDDQKYYNIGLELITEIFGNINNDYVHNTFAGGLSGVGWAFSHLVQNDFIDAEIDEVLGELDEFIYSSMIYNIHNGNYDFLHGALGNWMFFMNRTSEKKYEDYLIKLIDEIEKTSHKDKGGGLKWKSELNPETGKIGYNISLSHGMASIISVLSKVYTLKIDADRVLYLLQGAVRYLLNQKLDKEKYGFNFPHLAKESLEEISRSRLAWCYGDLGIGMSLYLASRRLGNKDWEKEALDVLLHSTQRRSLSENDVVDAGICHGTSGIAHIYNRMFFYTGIDDFKNASYFWIKETLRMAKFEDGFSGYKMWRSEKHGGWKAEAGLLEGVAGIGLALISAISDIEPAWDECLLLS